MIRDVGTTVDKNCGEPKTENESRSHFEMLYSGLAVLGGLPLSADWTTKQG